MESPRSEWLDAFVVFAELRNFTHAARALHLSQPALHVQIRRLAEALGVTLYRRNGRALELTNAGVEVLAFAREAQRRGSDLAASLRGDPSRDVVRLGAGEGSYLYLLGPAIRAFMARPRSELRLLVRDREGTLEAVRSGEVEVGVAVDGERPEELTFDALTTVGPVVVLPRAHRLAKKKSIAIADLAGERLVLPARGRPLRRAVAEAMSAANVDLDVAMEASGWELLVHFANLHVGLAIVNAFCRVPPALTKRPLVGLAPVRYVVATRTRGERTSARTRLCALLREHRHAWKTA